MSLFISILLASFLESIVSFSGAALTIFNKEKVKKAAHFIVSFAVGALLAVALLDLLPEAIEISGIEKVAPFVLGGIILFFILEKFLFWYHCHDGKCEVHSYTYLVLWGDFLHNFIDGVILALAFLVSSQIGWLTLIAIILHEIPQEISDFSILLYGGFSKGRALFYNFLVSLSTILGAVLTYFLGSRLEPFLPFGIALIAGNFLYIAMADLMPELHESTGFGHSVLQIVLLMLGAFLIILPGFIFGLPE